MKKRLYFGTPAERLKQAQEKFKLKFDSPEAYNLYCAEKVRRYEKRCKTIRQELTITDDILQ